MLIDAAQNSAFERKKKMSKFVVLTDSTCDLPDELAKQHDIDILCFKIALDGEGYTERVDFTPEQFCQMLRNATGLPTTAQITQFEFMERFEEYDRQGVEQALYISINAGGSDPYHAYHGVPHRRRMRRRRNSTRSTRKAAGRSSSWIVTPIRWPRARA